VFEDYTDNTIGRDRWGAMNIIFSNGVGGYCGMEMCIFPLLNTMGHPYRVLGSMMQVPEWNLIDIQLHGYIPLN
jgi:hypothetical protein